MAGDAGGGQDWWGLLYLFLAGIVTIAVDMVRRVARHFEELLTPSEECDHEHCRQGEPIHHLHRRRTDPPNDESEEPE